MTETSTVTSKGTINIPARIRRKYSIKVGDKIAFLEKAEGLALIRILPLNELFGSGRLYKNKLVQAVKELEAEHRREALE